MPKNTKRRKLLVFSGIGVVIAGLAAIAVFKKREPVITVQTEKVTRRNIIELVTANGRIQPVLQVKISPEVSGEITDLPVKEGQCVSKGEVILKIKPDFYIAQRNQSDAAYKSAVAGQQSAEAGLRKTEAEFKRQQDLYHTKLISDSAFDEAKAAYDMAKAQLAGSEHNVEMAHANLARSEEELSKTTVVAPLSGTITKLDSRLGERVVGTATYAGTEVMTISDLNEMEARVDIGEMDVILMKPGQHARLEVDAFKDRKFNGTVTEIANSSKTQPGAGSQEATKFEVKIRIQEKEPFRPGMSVTAEIETRSRTNVLSVPIASVTTRLPKEKPARKPASSKNGTDTNATPATNNTVPVENGAVAENTTNGMVASVNTNNNATVDPPPAKGDKKPKPIECVFLVEGDHAKMVPVKIGISDENYWEITEGLKEGDQVISGGFRAISRDLEDGKKIRIGRPVGEREKPL